MDKAGIEEEGTTMVSGVGFPSGTPPWLPDPDIPFFSQGSEPPARPENPPSIF